MMHGNSNIKKVMECVRLKRGAKLLFLFRTQAVPNLLFINYITTLTK